MRSIKKVVIFGATSAIAEHVARQLVERGASVFCVGRNDEKLASVLDDLRVRAKSEQVVEGLSCDLIDNENHVSLLNAADAALGGLDAVLIAHGSLPDQQNCEANVELMTQEFNTNAMSVLSLLTHAANRLENQGYGVIAAISSVAGDRGRQSNYVYGAAKGAVAIFMQGLFNRLSAKGIAVVTIKLGFVDTPMTASFDKGGILWAKPERVARGIIQAMVKRNGAVYLPWFWWPIMLVIKLLPVSIFNRLSL